MLVEAIKNAGYLPGIDAGISIDAAASEFYNQENGKYSLKLEGRDLSSEEMINYYKNWMEKYGSDDTYVYDRTGAKASTATAPTPMTMEDVFA